jgi:hypothetical protein
MLLNDEICDLYKSTGTVRTVKSRRLRWAGHVARIGETRNSCRNLVGRRI